MESENKCFMIVIVGNDVVRTVRFIFTQAGINWVNEVNLVKEGKLGNFKTFTYAVTIPGDDPQQRRKQITEALFKESTHLLTLYPQGAYFQMYVFDRRAFLE